MKDRLSERIALICICFCASICVIGVVLLALEKVDIPDGLVEVTALVFGGIGWFLAVSPLQK